MGKELHIIHFNDVYNVEARQQEPVGGAARFCTAVKTFKNLNPLVLFSGDAFSPSVLSNITKGKQMIPILNELDIQYSVIGNHDFDFGVDVLDERINETNFPWLMSNAIDSTTQQPLGNGLLSDSFEWQGIKIGIMGLVEQEWIETLSTLDPEDVTFFDFVSEGRKLAVELRENGADLVIALTHMRWPNDILLAKEVLEIDLILGGHDHNYDCKKINNCYVVKSGTDFRQFSHLTLTFNEEFLNRVSDAGKRPKFDLKFDLVQVDSSFEEDAGIKEILLEFTKELDSQMDEVIGHLEVDLDGCFTTIRRQETNLGNFITDIMLRATNAEIALLNSGTLRSDMVHSKGEFRMRDLNTILPMIDNLVVLKLTGDQLMECLENSVSKYPALEGRFAQVSGVHFAFDPSRPPGQRVDPRFVRVQGGALKGEGVYRLVTKAYLAEGKDGYDVLRNTEKLNVADEGVVLPTAVINHFRAVRVSRGEVKPKFVHRQSIIAICRKLSISSILSSDQTSNNSTHSSDDQIDLTRLRSSIAMQPIEENRLLLENIGFDDKGASTLLLQKQNAETIPTPDYPTKRTSQHQLERRISVERTSRLSLMRRQSIIAAETTESSIALAPMVEGRIVVINSQNRQAIYDTFASHNESVPRCENNLLNTEEKSPHCAKEISPHCAKENRPHITEENNPHCAKENRPHCAKENSVNENSLHRD